MKKLFFSLVVAACATSAIAQKNMAGGILLYGEGTYSSSKGSSTFEFPGGSTSADAPRLINYRILPGIGYNITNNLTVGVNVGYTGSKLDNRIDNPVFGDSTESKTRAIYAGPFIRYTAWMGEHFFAFTQFNASYMNGKNINYTATGIGSNTVSTEDKVRGLSASLFPAAGFMVNPSLGITFGIGGISYDYTKTDYDNGGTPGVNAYSKTSAFRVTIGQQFNLGVQKYFGCGRGHGMKKGHHEMMDDTRHMDTSDDEDAAPKKKKAAKDDDE